jgi:hypothetical protein
MIIRMPYHISATLTNPLTGSLARQGLLGMLTAIETAAHMTYVTYGSEYRPIHERFNWQVTTFHVKPPASRCEVPYFRWSGSRPDPNIVIQSGMA